MDKLNKRSEDTDSGPAKLGAIERMPAFGVQPAGIELQVEMAREKIERPFFFKLRVQLAYCLEKGYKD